MPGQPFEACSELHARRKNFWRALDRPGTKEPREVGRLTASKHISSLTGSSSCNSLARALHNLR